MEQIEGYLYNNAVDYYLKVMKRAGDLNDGKRGFFYSIFDIQWEKVIDRSIIITGNFGKTGRVTEPEEVEKALKVHNTGLP